MARTLLVNPRRKIVVTKVHPKAKEPTALEPKAKAFASTASLIDEYGALVEKLSAFAKDMKRKSALHDILAERVSASASGKLYAVEMERSVCSLLDQAKIRADMSLSWLSKYSKDSAKCSIRIRKLKKKAEKKAA